MRRFVTCIAPLAAAAVLAAPRALVGQPPPDVQVRGQVRSALEAQRAGDFPGARDRLTSARALCAQASDPAGCFKLVDFSVGYLSQIEADAGGVQATALLDTAAAYYRAVLAAAPGDSAATFNLALVYRRMGPHEWQEPFFQQAAAGGGSQAVVFQMLLGDYYRDRGWNDRALMIYAGAAQAEPDNPAPRYLLVRTADSAGPGALARLMTEFDGWRERFPGIAADGYRAVMRASYRSDPSLARAALARWADLRARDGTLPAAVADELPPGWSDTTVTALKAYFGESCDEAVLARSWARDRTLSEAVGDVVLARGQASLTAGRVGDAERCWRGGLHIVPPTEAAGADLRRELAELYAADSTLDPGGRRFRALENELFLGKERAINARDLTAMIRFHSTLGLIYARRGVWRSSDARNAMFQLRHALDAADDRARESVFQPLPHLQRLLAEGYRATDQRGLAAQAYLDAAMGYLDADDLASAQAALSAADSLRASRERLTAVGLVILLRGRLASPTTSSAERERACAPAGIDALFRRLDAVPVGAFRDRQRFKVLADCARLPGSLGVATAAQAVEQAATPGFRLSGVADFNRLATAQRVALGGVGIAGDALRADPPSTTPGRTGTTLALTPDGTRAFSVTITPEVRVAALAADRLLREVGALPTLKITGGDIEVVRLPAGVDSARVTKVLRALPGNLKIRPISK